jgi:hypothetical protein
MVLLWGERHWENCGAHGVIVGVSDIGGIVVHKVLLWEVAILGQLWCTCCCCGREHNWGNCGAYDVIVGGSDIGGIVLNMVLLWEGAILRELWCK